MQIFRQTKNAHAKAYLFGPCLVQKALMFYHKESGKVFPESIKFYEKDQLDNGDLGGKSLGQAINTRTEEMTNELNDKDQKKEMDTIDRVKEDLIYSLSIDPQSGYPLNEE